MTFGDDDRVADIGQLRGGRQPDHTSADDEDINLAAHGSQKARQCTMRALTGPFSDAYNFVFPLSIVFQP